MAPDAANHATPDNWVTALCQKYGVQDARRIHVAKMTVKDHIQRRITEEGNDDLKLAHFLAEALQILEQQLARNI